MIKLDFFNFLFNLGFIYITFDLIWRLILYIFKSVVGLNFRNNKIFYLFKTLGFFLLVTLTAVLTQVYVENRKDWVYAGFVLSGFLVLYFYQTSKIHQHKIQASMKMDGLALKRLRGEGVLLTASLLFYLLCLIYPRITGTLLTDWFYNLIDAISSLYLFKIIIGFFAILFCINMIIKGLNATFGIVKNFLALIGIHGASDFDRYKSAENSTADDTIDIEYEEVNKKKDV